MDGECSGCSAVIVSRWAGKRSPVRCQRPQQGEGAATWLSGAGGADRAIRPERGVLLERSGSTRMRMWLE